MRIRRIHTHPGVIALSCAQLARIFPPPWIHFTFLDALVSETERRENERDESGDTRARTMIHARIVTWHPASSFSPERIVEYGAHCRDGETGVGRTEGSGSGGRERAGGRDRIMGTHTAAEHVCLASCGGPEVSDGYALWRTVAQRDRTYKGH